MQSVIDGAKVVPIQVYTFHKGKNLPIEKSNSDS